MTSLYWNLVSVIAVEMLSNFDKRNNNYVHWTWMQVYIGLHCSNLSVASIYLLQVRSVQQNP